jgi:hypothetical protein
MADKPASGSVRPATITDIRQILGDVDDAAIAEIMALRPSTRDVEDASLWLAGDPDVFGARPPIKGTASKIVSIIAAIDENGT